MGHWIKEGLFYLAVILENSAPYVVTVKQYYYKNVVSKTWGQLSSTHIGFSEAVPGSEMHQNTWPALLFPMVLAPWDN